MTNIKTAGMWPKELPKDTCSPTYEALTHLFGLRRKTYRDFASIEKEKGFLKPEMSLSSPEGQEAVRILTQRGLEEMAEAYDSLHRDHYLEELIDAINYFWVLAIIDPKAPTFRVLNYMVDAMADAGGDPYQYGLVDAQTIGSTVLKMNPIFEKLRHRAWMNNPQAQYFDGWDDIARFLAENLVIIESQFKDWSEFVRYFIAKDNVLQFRIKTKY